MNVSLRRNPHTGNWIIRDTTGQTTDIYPPGMWDHALTTALDHATYAGRNETNT